MKPKTTLVPGVPWPTHYEKETTNTRRDKRFKVVAVPRDGLDFFAQAREQIATGAAKYTKKKNTKP
jgi:hypothetical protein